MSNINIPIKNLSVRFSREQRVLDQLTHKDALIDALILLYNNTAKCQYKNPHESTGSFIQLYKPICYEVNKTKVSLKDFQVLNKDSYVEGAFGKVTIVKSTHDKENIYAMKTLNKTHLIKQAGRSSPMDERLILSNENEVWIPKLYASFQDTENLYLVMEYAHGGDLENLMNIREYKFNQQEAQFYCAELVLAIERVHQLGYMHRDIKPANILIDNKGHIKLGDFGCCIPIDTTESLFPVGTAEYMSPEMSDSTFGTTVYGPEADWWSVGIILYELLYGVTPFTGKNSEIQKSLMNPKVAFNDAIDVTEDAKDLITKLLLKSKSSRLGGRGDVNEIKNHPFFKDINWNTLRTEATPPFIPSIKSMDDTTFFAASNMPEDEEEDEEDQSTDEEDEEEDDDALRDYQFIGYSYSCRLLNKDNSPSKATLEKRKSSDSQAFLAQFRHRMSLPSIETSKQVGEEKMKLQEQHDQKVAKLNSLLKEKDEMIKSLKQSAEKDDSSSISQQYEEEKMKLQEQHDLKVTELMSLLEEKDDTIKNLQKDLKQEKNVLIESHKEEVTILKNQLEEQHALIATKRHSIEELQQKNLNSEESSETKSLIKERDARIESQDHYIKELVSNISLLETSLDELTRCQNELENNLDVLVSEKTELENNLKQVVEDMREQSNTDDDALLESQKKVDLLQREINAYRSNDSMTQRNIQEHLTSLQAENKTLLDENRDLNEQLVSLEIKISQLNDTLIQESAKFRELTDQFETKLKNDASEKDILLQQTKAECVELKDQVSKLQRLNSAASKMKKSGKSLPNIPSVTSPKFLPTDRNSSSEGGSLILSSMWQRDKESLRTVQKRLEESENQLADSKRELVRLRREIKYIQKQASEHYSVTDDLIKENVHESREVDISPNIVDDTLQKNSFNAVSAPKKTSLPKTPPQQILDYLPSIDTVSSFMSDFEKRHGLLKNDVPIKKKNRVSILGTRNTSQLSKNLSAAKINELDLEIINEIREERNFINSTNRTIAARSRLSRNNDEVDHELKRLLTISSERISTLESQLQNPASLVL